MPAQEPACRLFRDTHAWLATAAIAAQSCRRTALFINLIEANREESHDSAFFGPGLPRLAAAAIATQLMIMSPAFAADVDLAPTKQGPVEDMIDITQVCGDKPIKVAYSDGYGATAWQSRFVHQYGRSEWPPSLFRESEAVSPQGKFHIGLRNARRSAAISPGRSSGKKCPAPE